MRRCALLLLLVALIAASDRIDRSIAAPPKLALNNVSKVKPKAKFKLPKDRYVDHPLQLSADGQWLAATYSGGGIKLITQIWDLSGEPKVVAEFDGAPLAVSPSGKFVFVKGTVGGKVYDIAAKKEVAKVPEFVSHGFFRDDTILVSTNRSYNFQDSTKGKITVWDIAKNADAGSFDIPDNRFNDAFPAKSGKEIWLFMSKDKFEVECYDVEAKKLARTVKPESDDGKKPYTSSGIYHTIASDSSVFTANVRKTNVFDAESGKIVGGLPEDLWDTASGLQLGATRYLAHPSSDAAKKAGLAETDWIIYDWKARKPLASLTGHSAGEKTPITAASADGKTLVSITEKGEGLVFDLSTVK